MQALGKVLLGLGIAVMFVMVVMAGKEFLYKDPNYSDYVERPYASEEAVTKEDCEAAGGKWEAFKDGPRPLESARPPKTGEGGSNNVERTGWCDQGFRYNEARKAHERNTFIALTIIGISAFIGGVIAVTAGAASPSTPAIGGGLAVGGIVVLFIGSAGYWGDMNDFLRFALAVLGFAIMISAAILLPKIVRRMQSK